MLKKNKIQASLIRGGTSKGVFFNEHELPEKGKDRDRFLLSIMGSPDPSGLQLNGLGGGISSTSKVALISHSESQDIDLNYLFGQVSVKKPEIDWSGSCGNLAAAVALYAMNREMVLPRQDGSTHVRIWQVNLGHEIRAKVYSPHNKNHWVSIPGVPGKGLAIYVDFINPSPSLLPCNQPIHELSLPDGRKIEATLICGVNPTIFVRASEIGLVGDELPGELDFQKLSRVIQHLCKEGAKIMQIPYAPAMRVAWLSFPKNHTIPSPAQSDKKLVISASECDILSRISTEGRVHHAYTGTGAINLACAAKIPGSIPYQIVQDRSRTDPLKIAHPAGVMCVDAKVLKDAKSQQWVASNSGFLRTAKILMVGDAYA